MNEIKIDEIKNEDITYMKMALIEARKAVEMAEVPIGAIVVLDGEIIGRGFNQKESQNDPTAHAEILAIRDAARNISSWRLENSTLYVTLEPCPMCAGAMIQARVKRLVFGASDPKAGVTGTLYNLVEDKRFNHQLEVKGGVLAEECSSLLKQFFSELRIRKDG